MVIENILKQAMFLDKTRSYSFRGIVMIFIICHHICQRVDNTHWVIKMFLGPFGYIGTGIFFFLSGFGLYMSLKNKKITCDWMKKKLQKLILPFFFIFLVVSPLYIFFSDQYTISDSIIDLLTLTLPYTTTWFFKVIVAIYILTYFVFLLVANNNIRVFLLTMLTFAYYIIAKMTLPNFWYTSILNFPLGLLFAILFDKLKVFNRGGYKILMFCTLTYVCIFIKFRHLPELLSLISTIYYCYAIRFVNVNNMIFSYIGKESLNFYLFHLAFLYILLFYLDGWLGYGISLLFLTIVCSLLYSFVIKHNSSIIK